MKLAENHKKRNTFSKRKTCLENQNEREKLEKDEEDNNAVT